MKQVFLLAAFFTIVILASAQSDKSGERLTPFNLSNKTLAIEGYDPVSYFSGSPKKGAASTLFNARASCTASPMSKTKKPS